MDSVFDVLLELTTDPFAMDACAVDPAAVLAVESARDLAPAAASAVAGGAWSACEVCSDPGNDPVPPRKVSVSAPRRRV
jgi:hypothetical protein